MPEGGWSPINPEQFSRLFAELPLVNTTLTEEGYAQWTFRGGVVLEMDPTRKEAVRWRVRLEDVPAAGSTGGETA